MSGTSLRGIIPRGGERAPLLVGEGAYAPCGLPGPQTPPRSKVRSGLRHDPGQLLELVVLGHQSRRSTSFLKTSPRCSKLSNMSKLAHAGERSTTSPGIATAFARSMADCMESQYVSGIEAAASAAPIFFASSPISTVWITCPRAASASGSHAWPLPLPPAINTIRPGKLSRALSVDATLVPLESLKYWTPRRSRTQ